MLEITPAERGALRPHIAASLRDFSARRSLPFEAADDALSRAEFREMLRQIDAGEPLRPASEFNLPGFLRDNAILKAYDTEDWHGVSTLAGLRARLVS